MEYVLTIIALLLTYLGIRTLIEKVSKKNLVKDFAECEEKERQRDIERQHQFTLVATMIEDFYDTLLSEYPKPDCILSANIIRARNTNDLETLKNILPDEWLTCTDRFDCWIKDNVLYIILPKDEALAKARNTPAAYNTDEKICSAFRHWAIPFDSILYYKAVGDIFRTERIIGGGNISYTGVSVNGIGFGELKHDPVITMSEINDSRYVVLYYQDNAENPLQTIYFCYDSLDTLIRLIPQFEK